MNRLIKLSLAFFGICSLISCGGSGNHEEEEEFLRVLHVAPDTPALSVFLDKELLADDVLFGDVTSYFTVLEGKVALEVKSEESVVPLIDSDQTIAAGKAYSLVLYEDARSDTLKATLQEDDLSQPEGDDQAKVRFSALAPSLTSADVYIVNPGVSIRDVSPAKAGLAYKGFSDYFEIDAGTYEIKVTEANSKTVLAQSGIISIESGQIATFLFFDERGGGTPLNSKLVIDNED